MPETRTIEVFQFSELEGRAKDKAQQWFIEGMDDWWDSTVDDFCTIANLIGLEIKQEYVATVGGGSKADPHVYLSVCSGQGDGASFEGSWNLGEVVGAVERLKGHVGHDPTLFSIVGSIESEAVAFLKKYPMGGRVMVTTGQRYAHSLRVDANPLMENIQYELGDDYPDDDTELCGDVFAIEEQAFASSQALAVWLYRRLEEEYEYQTSDEAIADSMEANNFRFTEDGHLFKE